MVALMSEVSWNMKMTVVFLTDWRTYGTHPFRTHHISIETAIPVNYENMFMVELR